MELDEKKSIAFSLMATLNNTSRDIFSCVYMPIFKYGLSQYSKVSSAGQDIDLQGSILDSVGITIPLLTIHKMLNALNTEISKKEKTTLGFNILERGKCFQITGFEYREIDNIIDNERRKVNALNSAFTTYCADCPPSESFNDFIRFNFSKLTGFFSSNKVIDLDSSYLAKFKMQANFLRYIEANSPELYDIAKNVYIGSFITVLLETGFTLEAKSVDSINYFLDTRIILSALNLQTEIEFVSSNELLELIRKNKGIINVMDKTIEEIEFNLSNAIYYFDSNPVLETINNSTINAAAIRTHLTKTDLQLLVKNIRRNITDKLHANVVNVSQVVTDKSKKSDDLTKLEHIRERRPATALHDIIAIFQVRELRGGFINNHKKAKYWFISDNDGLYNFDTSIIPQHNVPEVVLTEDLAFLLWLKDINKGNAPFLQTGLKEYISRILVSDLPDYKILDDLYRNVQKYKETDPESAHYLMDSLAHASYTQIKQLNVTAETEPDKFKQILLTVKNDKIKEKQIIEEQLESTQHEYSRQKEISSNLEKSNESLKLSFLQLQKDILSAQKEQYLTNEIAINQMKIKNKLYLRIVIMTVVSSLLILITFFSFNFLTGIIKIAIPAITALGGLWSFISLIINIRGFGLLCG